MTATYQDEADEFEESPSCANVKRVTDGSTGQAYTYVYDEYTGRPTEYSVQNSDMSLKVFSAGSDKVKYEFDDGNLNYEDQITYDEDCLLSPRITKAYNNSDWGMNWKLTYDEKTGEQAYKPVVQLFRNKTKEWYHVFVEGEEIICTGGHPFYVVNVADNRERICFENKDSDTTGKWIMVKDLKILDKVLLSDGSYGIITTISIEKLSMPETTYNFEVADFHTYYVSDSRVLVHNKCTTDLYRAMSDEEYGSLTKYNKFKHKLGTMQDKWMATTYEDAVKWGNTLMGEGNFRVVKIKVPTNSLNNMFFANYSLDGIGKAYCAHYKYLNEVMISFSRVL